MGDVIADINKKRGRVMGMEPEGDKQKVLAEVPLVEIRKYATELRSLTQGRGGFTKELVRYEEVPEIELVKAIESIKEARK
jgi:elongation factor G